MNIYNHMNSMLRWDLHLPNSLQYNIVQILYCELVFGYSYE